MITIPAAGHTSSFTAQDMYFFPSNAFPKDLLEVQHLLYTGPCLSQCVSTESPDTTRYKHARRRIWTILLYTLSGKGWKKSFPLLLTFLILVNVVAAAIETDPTYSLRYGRIFDFFAIIAILVFTIEYILRLWSAVEDPRYHVFLGGRLRYAFTPLALIDFFSIAPFVLFLLISNPDLISYMRFARIFWILKLGHYSPALITMGRVLKAKKQELFMTFFILFVLLILFSGAMFFLEHQAQPEKFSSILSSMWWGVETLSTVGYGDIIPITPLGRLLGSIVAMTGIALFAIPAGIFASGFMQELKKGQEDEDAICPHCGKNIREPVSEPGSEDQNRERLQPPFSPPE
jgi:voltage-gated potassium channel